MKKIIALLAALAVFAAFAPACHKKAATDAEGGGKRAKKTRKAKEGEGSASKTVDTGGAGVKGGLLYVIVDRGIKDDMTDYQVKNRNQTGDWMDEDLSRLLGKAGFDVHVINKHSERKGGNLLVVRITNYNPGSTAARAFVGYGAGAASMNIHYEVFGSGSSPILSGDDGVGSSRDWRNVIRKLDEKVVRAVSEKLGK